ncbi:uncharacterized protein LOC143295727 [Babylonia areolata]|uniref:uncharacterized protein LOC143295727 n=1 Tax=Babylonia areolata TaxID=304850 RepID=UPI003FD3E8A0
MSLVSISALRHLRFIRRNPAITTPTPTPTPQPAPTATPPASSDQCTREFLYFKFTTSASVRDIKQQFEDVNVIYSFKAYGANLYIFVVENDHSQALKDLSLPPDASLSQAPLPVELGDTFFARFSIPFPPVTDFPDFTDLPVTLVERTWDPKGLNEIQYAAVLRSQAEEAADPTGRMFFAPVAAYPTQFLLLWSQSDCDTAEDLYETSESLGGPSGITTTNVLRLFVI